MSDDITAADMVYEWAVEATRTDLLRSVQEHKFTGHYRRDDREDDSGRGVTYGEFQWRTWWRTEAELTDWLKWWWWGGNPERRGTATLLGFEFPWLTVEFTAPRRDTSIVGLRLERKP